MKRNLSPLPLLSIWLPLLNNTICLSLTCFALLSSCVVFFSLHYFCLFLFDVPRSYLTAPLLGMRVFRERVSLDRDKVLLIDVGLCFTDLPSSGVVRLDLKSLSSLLSLWRLSEQPIGLQALTVMVYWVDGVRPDNTPAEEENMNRSHRKQTNTGTLS